MKNLKPRKIIGFAILALVLIFLLWIGYIYFILPRIPVPDIKVKITKERVERGKYLANHITVCMDCHSTREWTKFSGPVAPGTEGKGGERFDQQMEFPGTIYSSNITPHNLANWTDGEIYRAITSGVGKENQPLFPVMPYADYSKLDTEDIYSIIAYLRSLPPIPGKTPESKTDFPENIILHTIPSSPAPQTKPVKSDTIEYGKYIVTGAGCVECHTRVKNDRIIPALAFSGGREFRMPDGLLYSPNITPDNETGIGLWTRSAFISRFKAYDLSVYIPQEVKKGDPMTLMHWTMYAGMDTSDLISVYAYLRSLKPVRNQVVRWIPAR
jgi:hypothetical protein